jgi:hypothetical protein
MEMQLSSVGATAPVVSLVASPMRSTVGVPAALVDRGMSTRSISGVGVYHVPAFWRLENKGVDRGCAVAIPAELDQQDPHFSTHKFTTRQGPPTCSPPV